MQATIVAADRPDPAARPAMPAADGAGPGSRPAADGPSAPAGLLARGRIRGLAGMLGPAFVASVAYVDPGNFATNIQGGAQYGYLLLWVVLAANLMAMLVQYLSAKLGIVTVAVIIALNVLLLGQQFG
jgi:manganese transport protein